MASEGTALETYNSGEYRLFRGSGRPAVEARGRGHLGLRPTVERDRERGAHRGPRHYEPRTAPEQLRTSTAGAIGYVVSTGMGHTTRT